MSADLRKTLNKTGMFLIVLLSGALLSWFMMPSVRYSFRYPIIAIASTAIMCLIFIMLGTVRKDFLKVILTVFGLALIFFIVPYSFGIKDSVNTLQQLVIFLAPMFIGMMIIEKSKENKKLFSVFLTAMCIMIVVVYFATVKELSINPAVMRNLATGDNTEELVMYRMSNVGGFGFAYAMGIMSIVTFYLTLYYKGLLRFVFLVLSVVMVSFIYKSQYTTLLILLIATVFVLSIIKSKHILTKLILLFFGLITVLFVGDLFSWAASVTNLTALKLHFSNIADFFLNGNVNTTRPEYYAKAFNLFLTSPLIGVVGITKDPVAWSIINQSHSTQLPILAETGLIGSILYNCYLFFMWRTIQKALKRNGNSTILFTLCFIYIFILSWINPVFLVFELSMVVFAVVPSIICLFDFKKII